MIQSRSRPLVFPFLPHRVYTPGPSLCAFLLRSMVCGEGSGTAARRSCPSWRAEGTRKSPGLAGSYGSPGPGQPPRCPCGSRRPRSRPRRRRLPPRAPAGQVRRRSGSGLAPTASSRTGKLARPAGAAPAARGRKASPRMRRGTATVMLTLPAGGCLEGRRGGSRTGWRLPGQPAPVQVDAGGRSLQMPGRCWPGREGAP